MLGPRDGPPMPPMNLAADYGGGTMFLLFGVLAALIERSVSGKGQVVDAAMIDGVPAMMGLIYQSIGQGDWGPDRQANLLDGGAPFYRCYTCADGKAVAVGALEPQFYAQLIKGLGLSEDLGWSQYDRTTWSGLHQTFAEIFASETRDHWAAQFGESDACVAPVLTHEEAAAHPHNIARGLFPDGGTHQAAVAPRFSRSVPAHPEAPQDAGADTEDILAAIGWAPGHSDQGA